MSFCGGKTPEQKKNELHLSQRGVVISLSLWFMSLVKSFRKKTAASTQHP
jgi:hypothetical protein